MKLINKYDQRIKIGKFSCYFLISFYLLSCSQLNTESRDHYNESNPFRHGLMGSIIDIEFVSKAKTPVSEESIQRGKSVYNQFCISCHGPRGRGDGPEGKLIMKTPKNLAKLSQRVEKLRFFLVESKEKGKMPGWRPFFTERNIVDLEQYIRTFNSEE